MGNVISPFSAKSCMPGSFLSKSCTCQLSMPDCSVIGMRARTITPSASVILTCSLVMVLPSAGMPLLGRLMFTRLSLPGTVTCIITLPRALPKLSLCSASSVLRPGLRSTPTYSQASAPVDCNTLFLPTRLAATLMPLTRRLKILLAAPFIITLVCDTPNTCLLVGDRICKLLSSVGNSASISSVCSAFVAVLARLLFAAALSIGVLGAILLFGKVALVLFKVLLIVLLIAPLIAALPTMPLAGKAFSSMIWISLLARNSAATAAWLSGLFWFSFTRVSISSSTFASQPAMAKLALSNWPLFISTNRLPASFAFLKSSTSSVAPCGKVVLSSLSTWVSARTL